jgi:predicted peptidase
MSNLSSGIHLQKFAGQNCAIYIPHRYALGKKVPLVMLLHWGGKKYRYIGREILELFGLPVFSEMEAVIIAPDRKRRHWVNEKSLKDIKNLVDYLDQHFNLDPDRRVVAGYSEGGLGVWYLGSEDPSLFHCGVSGAAPIPDDIDSSNWTFPIFSLNGRFDELIPHDVSRARAQEMKNAGAPVEFETVEGAMHADVRSYVEAAGKARTWVMDVWETGRNGNVS